MFGPPPDELPLFAALELVLPATTLQVDVHVTTLEQLVHDGVTHFDLGRENQHLRLSFGRANRRLEREVAYSAP
jgi:hypothetical protein